MTYARFHLIFNLPLLMLLLLLGWHAPWAVEEAAAFGWVMLAVIVFTSPWDNFAAKWGIWGFPRAKYSLRLGYLPLEEYVFFLLQGANVMLAVRAFFHFFPDWLTGREVALGPITLILLGASLIPWALVALQLRWLRRKCGPRVNYAVHLAWFLPFLYFQWVMAPQVFGDHLALLALITVLFGVYYTVADFCAVRAGTWYFDDKQITGVKLAGLLPWEEIAFFFITTLLVAQSYLLLLPGECR